MCHEIIQREITSKDELGELAGIPTNTPIDKPIVVITQKEIWLVPVSIQTSLADADDIIDEVNSVISTLSEEHNNLPSVVRIVAHPSLLVECVKTVITGGPKTFQSSEDRLHVTGYSGQTGALLVDEWLPELHLYGSNIAQFLLPNRDRTIYLTEEIAQAAIVAKKPELACWAYAEAFKTNPYFSFSSHTREQFELVSLMAGNKLVPYFDEPALELFEHYTDTYRLPDLPEIENNCEILVYYPEDSHKDPAEDFPAIYISELPILDKLLIYMGNYLVYEIIKEEIPSNYDLNFFLRRTKEAIAVCWDIMTNVQRLQTDIACIRHFTYPISATPLADPPMKESIAAYLAIKTGMIPPKMAINMIRESICEYEVKENL